MRGRHRQRGVSHQDVNNRDSKIRQSSERERKLDECTGKRKWGVKGRETFVEFKKRYDLDFCLAWQGKTVALAPDQQNDFRQTLEEGSISSELGWGWIQT